MNLTVAICTLNRAELLRRTLEHLTHLAIPDGVQWELIIVNNGSTDGTDHVVAEYATRLPIRPLHEPTLGQAHARNAAIRGSRGDYILWTDDDVLVDPNWMAAYTTAFKEKSHAAFFGGPVRPFFTSEPPAWLREIWPLVESAFALRDLGEVAFRFRKEGSLPFGANFAVKASDQRNRRYDPRLGLRPGSEIRGDETALLSTLLAEGKEGWWVPKASVRHLVPQDRMRLRYLRRFFAGYGRSLAIRAPSWNGPSVLGKPRWLWRRALQLELEYRLRRMGAPPAVWMRSCIEASVAWGHLVQAGARVAAQGDFATPHGKDPGEERIGIDVSENSADGIEAPCCSMNASPLVPTTQADVGQDQ